MKESKEDREQRERAALRLMEALSAAEEELLEHAQGETGNSGKGRKRRNLWQYGRAWAAAVCLLAVGALSWGGISLMNMRMGSADGDSSGNAYEGGHQAQALEEGAAISGGQAEDAAGDNGAAPQDFSLEEAAQEEKKQEEEGYPTDGQAGDGQQGSGQDGNSQQGNDQDGSGPRGNGQNGDSQQENDMQQGNFSPEGAEDSIGEQEAAGCLAAPQRQKLTEAQARKSELGAYVPKALPAGYILEEASRETGEEDSQTLQDLRLTWFRGLDSITIRITRDEKREISVVDVDIPQTYDLRLYEIPLTESVPREYWESVNNPVFAAEDLSLEAIESRMISGTGDSGDTDTPRGNFAVLYSDGVLVEFSGRGTAEEIWNMFEGLE